MVATTVRRLDGLAVEDAGGGLLLPPLQAAGIVAQGIMHLLPGAVGLPAAEVAIDTVPRRIVVRQRSPGTAAGDKVENGVRQISVGVRPRTAARLGARDEMLDVGPLEVREIAGIWLPCHGPSVVPRQNPGKIAFSTPSKEVARQWIAENLAGMNLKAVAKALHDFLAGGGVIDQVKETRPEWSRWPYHYDFRLMLDGRRIYVETILQDDDPNDPTIEIVSIHDA